MYFESPALWRAWLTKHHKAETSLLVGMRKVSSGAATMTWPESVDEALCFGWIDGLRRSLGVDGYTIRFSVRKKGSIWSRVN
ncbi:MAG TPA: bacteriocin-protection protein, partial [Opitutaceae bacterium]|nr:bacteriocin-protection protein [Opitutaceae bacterium]